MAKKESTGAGKASNKIEIESSVEESAPVMMAEAPVTREPLKPEFYLPEERIQVRYIKKQSGYIKNPNHIAYGGMLEGTTVKLPAKQDRSGNYIPVLTKEEQAGLEKLMQVDAGFLSPHKTLNNFWDSQVISLTKEGLYLNLDNPYDFIKYKILLTYEDFVSPSIQDTHLKKSYRFEIVRKTDVKSVSKEKVDYKRKAYMLFGKMEDSREALAGVIRRLTGKTASTNDHDFLITQVGELVEADAQRFVTILEDPNYKIKLFIEMAVSANQILKNRNRYTSKDGFDLCEEGEVPTLENTIKFLTSEKNQDIKLAIEAGMSKN